jgi:transglutaminase-like putative cysteine protease
VTVYQGSLGRVPADRGDPPASTRMSSGAPLWQRYAPREGWLSVILLFVMIWAVVHSVEEAEWVERLNTLVPLGTLGLLVGLAAAKGGLRPVAAHILSSVAGVEVIVLVYANRMTPGPWGRQLAELLAHVGAWIETAAAGGNSRDNVMFALVMSALAWAVAYTSAWFVFKRAKGWVALGLTSIALLVHLSYSYASLNYHLYILLFAGLLLLVRLELSRRQAFWDRAGLAVQGQVVRNVIATSAVAVLLVMNLAGRGPAEQPTGFLEPAWARIADTWQRGQSQFDRLFGGVQGPPIVVVGLAFSGTMQPREGFELGVEPVLRIEAPRSRYWRTTTYETYTGQGVVSGDVYGDRFEADQPIPLPFGAGEAREEMEQRVTILAPQSNLVFAADAPVRVSVPTLFEWRQNQDDPAALRLTSMIRRGQQYTVVSAASIATEAQLRSAGEDYPAGVERYLQLPPALPDRVRLAAAEVADPAPTPYDKALAVENYMRRFPYETHVPPPPADRDWVDYTLFDMQSGYSDYLATAMMVMLRTQGIPARVVSGFAPGSFDENEAAYIVYESEAHSWVEVFFPRYGWINFEPSSLRAAPFRPLDESGMLADPSAMGEYMEGLDPYFEDPYLDYTGGEFFPPLPERRDAPWIIGLALVLALVVVAILAYLGLLAIFRRGLRGLPWHVQWYAQFRRLAGWAGLGGRPSQTPFEYTEWLEQRFPGTRPLVTPITECYVEGAYSGRQPDPEQLARAAQAWEKARRPLARRAMLRGIIAIQARVQELKVQLRTRRRPPVRRA